MNRARIEELRAELDAERISWGELAEIESAFAELDPATLRDLPEHALASDMLDELSDHAERLGTMGTNLEWVNAANTVVTPRVKLDTAADGQQVDWSIAVEITDTAGSDGVIFEGDTQDMLNLAHRIMEAVVRADIRREDSR